MKSIQHPSGRISTIKITKTATHQSASSFPDVLDSHASGAGKRRAGSRGSSFFTLLLAGALVFVGRWAAAQQTCDITTCPAPAGMFNNTASGLPVTETASSMGIFEIFVNANFASGPNDLLDPGTVGSTVCPGVYPGWNSGTISGCLGPLCPSSGLVGTLISPVVVDIGPSYTVISRSAPQVRFAG